MAVTGRLKRFLNPENSLRVAELFYAILVVSLSYGWCDNGIEPADLSKGDFNENSNITFFMVVGMASLLYLAAVILYSGVGSPKILSPCFDVVTSCIFGLFNIIASIALAISLKNLGQSLDVREAGLTFGSLQAALAFSLGLAILFGLSAGFAACLHNKRNDFILNSPRTNMTDLPDDIPT